MKKITLALREDEPCLECDINGAMLVLRRGEPLEVPDELYEVLVQASEVTP